MIRVMICGVALLAAMSSGCNTCSDCCDYSSPVAGVDNYDITQRVGSVAAAAGTSYLSGDFAEVSADASDVAVAGPTGEN